jgi:DNA-binding IclR family transcriptional regulator
MQSIFICEPEMAVARGVKAKRRAKPSYSAPALEKGLEILELLASTQAPMSNRAIAERLGRSKGEIFRMVFVLVARGYLQRDAVTEELTLSNKLFELGIRTPRPRQLAEVAVPAMERLSERTGQSAHLVVVNKGDTVVIATTAGSADVSFSLRLGYRRPALLSTSGQVVIAFQSDVARIRLIEEGKILTNEAIDGRAVARRLDTIVRQGHLVAESHDVMGVTDIAAPILDRHGHAIASIVVPYLTRRGTAPVPDSALGPLLETCREIGASLR